MLDKSNNANAVPIATLETRKIEARRIRCYIILLSIVRPKSA
jgi:hypothetical protein